MPAVPAINLYEKPVRRKNNGKNDEYPTDIDIDGYELYKRFDQCVILEENMRFHNDKKYGEGCQLARLGIWPQWFIDILNDRTLSTSSDFNNHEKFQESELQNL
eukprot:Awhi_evm3s7823